MPLVSSSQLIAIRSIAYKGLDTPFELYKRSRVESAFGTDTVWTKVADGFGWLRMMNRPKTRLEAGLIEGAESIYRFHTSVDLSPVPDNGDRIKIGSLFYEIHDVNFDDTVQVFRTMVLRRLE